MSDQPDWPPRGSAIGLKDDTYAHGSTGQLWRVEREQWVRVKETPTQQAWKVWVKVGANQHADFIEDITIYDCAEKPGYLRGTVTLDDLVSMPRKA